MARAERRSRREFETARNQRFLMIPLRDTIRSRSTPSVTILIIAANTLVFLYMFSLDSYTLNHFIRAYAMTPYRAAAGRTWSRPCFCTAAGCT